MCRESEPFVTLLSEIEMQPPSRTPRPAPPASHSYTDTFTITCIRVTGVAMQDEAVELSSSSRAVYGSSALHQLDLRGAAARLDAAAAPRGVLLDQDLREVIRVGRSSSRGGLGICERIVSRGGEKAGSRRGAGVEAAGSRGGEEIRLEMGIGR